MLACIRRYFERRKLRGARSRIPDEAYQLIDDINSRYSGLDLNGGEFAQLDERQKLSRLIEMINQDSEISKLNSLAHIGRIRVIQDIEHARSEGVGVTLAIGGDGLFIYDFNDFIGKHDEIPAGVDSLARYDPRLDAESLKRSIANYTDRRNYERHVLDFDVFQKG